MEEPSAVASSVEGLNSFAGSNTSLYKGLKSEGARGDMLRKNEQDDMKLSVISRHFIFYT